MGEEGWKIPRVRNEIWRWQMEESKSIKGNFSEQAPNIAFTSSESLSISTETSSFVVEQSQFGLQQETVIETTDSKLMKNASDAFSVGKISLTGEDIADKLQQDIQENSTSLQQNFESSHRQEFIDGSNTSIQQNVLDTTSENQNNSTASSNVLASDDDDDVVVISLASSGSVEKPKEVLQNSLQQHEEISSTRVAEGHLTNASSATIETKKQHKRLPPLPYQHKTQRGAANGKKKTAESAKTSLEIKQVNQSRRGHIDTAAPIESVKEEVSKFGGIVDWKAYRAQTQERHRHIQSELERLQKEIPNYKKQSEAAEQGRVQVLSELGSTKRIIEELKLNLERAQTEESQAKEDSELAQLRVKEAEEGISGETSIAAKAQLEVANARYKAAVTEMKSVREELKSLRGNYVSLLKERDLTMRKAEDAISTSKEIEKTVEDLTLELITAKEALEAAHAEHLEAEEHKIGASLAKDQDCLTWEKELNQTEEEVEQLNQHLLSKKDIKSKLDIASTLLLELKAKLAAYKESRLKQESEITEAEKSSDNVQIDNKSQVNTQALLSTKKELEEVKASIDKSRNEVDVLRAAVSSLKSELNTEKSALMSLQQREGMASVAVSSLEAELDKTKKELEVVTINEKEARNKMMELPKLLQQAALEADQAKSVVQFAREDLWKAKEDAEEVKASATTIEVRLNAALKETQAAKASERLACDAIKALEESEQASSLGVVDSSTGVTLPLDEYFNLSKQAHDAEILSQERVAFAISQIQSAKDSESSSLARLKEAQRNRDRCKESLKAAMEKAEKAKEGKMGAEQKLRNWRAEHERKRKANYAAKNSISPLSTPPGSVVHSGELKFSKMEEIDILVQPVQPGRFKHSGELNSLKNEENTVLPQAMQPGFFQHSGKLNSLKKEKNDVLVQPVQPGSFKHSSELNSLKNEENTVLPQAMQLGFFQHSGKLNSLKKEENDVLVQPVQPGSFKHSGKSESSNRKEHNVLLYEAPDEKVYISESSPETVIPRTISKKKKKSLFRILMFLIKKKHQSSN